MSNLPKFFNTAGPIPPDIHYNVDPLMHINLPELESLIYQRKYFVLHTPRQTGKTSCLLALRDYLNVRGEFYAVYANVEAGQASRNQKDEVSRHVTYAIANRMSVVTGNRMPLDLYQEIATTVPPIRVLRFICVVCARRSTVLCWSSSMKSTPWWGIR